MSEKVTIRIKVDSEKAKTDLQKTGKIGLDAAKKIEIGFKSSTSALKVMQGVLGANVLVGAFNKLKDAAVGAMHEIVGQAASMQDLTTRFEVLTGSVAEAQKIMGDLAEFSAKTPFQLPGIAEAAAGLKAFGFSTSELLPNLKKIGDVAAASGTDLNGLGLIFGQVKAAGKLMGDRLLQLQERGIPIGKALADSMGVAEAAVRDLVAAGKVKFKDFERAFASLSAKGGFAFEGMEKKSRTFNGAMSTLKDNIGLAASDIGTAFIPVLTDIAKEFTSVVAAARPFIREISKSIASYLDRQIKELSETFKLLRLGIYGTRQELEDFLSVLYVASTEFEKYAGAAVVSIGLVTTSLWFLSGAAASAAAATATAVTAAATAIGVFVTAVLVPLAVPIVTVTAAIAGLTYVIKKLMDYQAANNPAVIEQRRLVEEASAAYMRQSGVLQDYKSEMTKSNDVLLAQLGLLEDFSNYDDTTIKKIKIEADAPIIPYALPSENKEREYEETRKAIEEERKRNERIQAERAEHLKILGDLEKQYRMAKYEADRASQISNIENQYNENELIKLNYAERDVLIQEQIFREQEIKREAIELEIKDEMEKKKALLKLDIESAQRRLALNKAVDKKEIDNKKATEQQLAQLYAARNQAILSGTVQLGQQIISQSGSSARKQFVMTQSLMLAQAIMSAYAASNMALATPPGPPWTAPLAALTLTNGLINAGVIAAMTAVKLGSSKNFADGGIVSGTSFSGDRVQINANSGEMWLNKKQQAELFKIANGKGKNNSNSDILEAINRLAERPVILVANDEQIARSANRGFENGVVIGGRY